MKSLLKFSPEKTGALALLDLCAYLEKNDRISFLTSTKLPFSLPYQHKIDWSDFAAAAAQNQK
jgi:hypothetical protein